MPTFVSLEPTNYCQLRCPECPVGMGNVNENHNEKEKQLVAGKRRKPAKMSMALCRKAIDAVARDAHTVIFHFQGEPLLHPALAEMVTYAHSRRLYTMLSTNGQAMTVGLAQALAQAGLDQIIVSVDGLSETSYSAYRVGGSHAKALQAIRFCREAGIPEVVLQCLKLRTNEHEWNELKRSYKQLGATRLELKTAQFYDYEHGHPLMPTHARDARYIQGADGRYHLKQPLRNRCYRLWSGCVITAEGDVLPCCFDKDAAYPFGNLQEQSLHTIWHSPAAEAFRAQLLTKRKTIPICCNCTE